MEFLAYLDGASSAPSVNEDTLKHKPYVYFGADNLYPVHVRELLDNSAPLATCVELAARHIAGEGVEFLDENGEPIDEAYERFKEWVSDSSESDFLYNTATDIASLNGRTWRITPKRGEAGIARLNHFDVFAMRSGKLVEGKVEEYWYSWDWTKERQKQYRRQMLPAFDYEAERMDSEALDYSMAYKPLRMYYSEPIWLPVTKDAQMWAEARSVLLNATKTSFKPSTHVNLHATVDDEQADKVEKAFKKQYASADAEGVLFTITRSGTDEAVTVTQIPQSDLSTHVNAACDSSEDNIYSGFGVPSILVKNEAHGLTSQAMSIREQMDVFYARVVRPLQRKHITAPLERLMAKEGIECKVNIKPISVFSDRLTQATREAIRTIDELRVMDGLEEIDNEELFKNGSQTDRRTEGA